MLFKVLFSLSTVLAWPSMAQESEVLGGFTQIHGAYDVTETYEQQTEEENLSASLEKLIPFLKEETPREVLQEKPYAGKFSLLNRRSDRKTTFDVSVENPSYAIEETDMVVRIHQCVKDYNSQAGNDVAFVEVSSISPSEEADTLSAESVQLFSGWIYKQYPSTNQFEHPVYSLTLLGCAE